MVQPERLTEILASLDGVANAPLTDSQRLQRAEPVLRLAGLSLSGVTQAVQSADLPWNQNKAREYGIPVETWLEAQRIVGLPRSETLAELLAGIHRAEAAANMLKAGYRAEVEATGRVTWLAPQRA